MKLPAPKPMPESQVVKECIVWLFLHGCFVWRNNTGGYKPEGYNRFVRFGLKGSADIIGVNPRGAFISVECKSGKNDLQVSQREFREKIKARNGIYIVARGIDDLEAHKMELLA